MIKIEHINGDEKYVTKGAFESVFKPLGYKLVAKEVKEEIVAPKVDEKNIDLGNEDKEDKEIGKENSKEVIKRK